ncbi:MAG TPA: TMEM165/GDT1 family protein [Chloroflexia bacterium]|nr:TMEM165/GDT1 family protein [Chloroflexia bacterium]
MDFSLVISTFALIFVAELPDKTALASLVLATRYKPLVVFTGAAAAFVIQSLVAICVGGLFSLLPESLVHRVAGALFLLFAVLMWRRNQEKEEESVEKLEAKEERFHRGVWAAFLVVFLAEWGDLTQLSTATLAAKYHDPVSIFIGATLALWAVAALAITLGNRASLFINPALTQRIAAVIFAVLGLALLLGLL